MQKSLFSSLILLSIGVCGCSSDDTQTNTEIPPSHDLWEVAGLLREYTAEYKKGPSRLTELAKNQTLYPSGFNALKTREVVVLWGTPMPSQGGAEKVIAYEKTAETSGGHVLLQSGEIKQMTSEEFRSAPKAK